MSNETANPTPKFEDARVRGSIRPWPKVSDYIIKDGHLIAAGDQAGITSYFPFAYPEILGEFTRLVASSESEVLNFGRRWGQLGYSGVHGRASPEETAAGDPLDWIMDHASQV